MAAYREGMKTVLIPKDNESDLYEVDQEVKDAVRFVPMTDLSQVLKEALVKPKTIAVKNKENKGDKEREVLAVKPAKKPAEARM